MLVNNNTHLIKVPHYFHLQVYVCLTTPTESSSVCMTFVRLGYKDIATCHRIGTGSLPKLPNLTVKNKQLLLERTFYYRNQLKS